MALKIFLISKEKWSISKADEKEYLIKAWDDSTRNASEKKFVLYGALFESDIGNWWPTKLGQSEVSHVWWWKKAPEWPKGQRRCGEQSASFSPFSVTFVLCYLLWGRFLDKGGLRDDFVLPKKRRGCPLESGRKGGRNKSSTSNRGRASARFYSRTLNSIAIGFSSCL